MFWLGGEYWNYAVMITGRVIFGIGGETLNGKSTLFNRIVCQSVIVGKWFKGKELAFALGLNISFSRLASFVNNVVEPRIYDFRENIGDPLLVGLGTCVVSLLLVFALVVFDRYADRKDKENNNVTVGEDEKIRCQDIKEFRLPYWLVTLNCVLTYGAFFPFMNVAQGYLIAV